MAGGPRVGVGTCLWFLSTLCMFFFSDNYPFLVDIISNLLKLYRQVINIDFLHTLSHLSKPLRFWQRYIVVLRKSHALFSISYREQQKY